MKEQIKQYIVETFLYGQGTVGDDQSLFDSGIIDSLGFIKLLAFIEETFKVDIDRSEVGMENFNTVNDILATIQGKQKA
jgi:acyl carrier protein